jgi:hypothetical protein
MNNFFGETSNHLKVVSSKLYKKNERDELEQELSIIEFHKAVKMARDNTAPGINYICSQPKNKCMYRTSITLFILNLLRRKIRIAQKHIYSISKKLSSHVW